MCWLHVFLCCADHAGVEMVHFNRSDVRLSALDLTVFEWVPHGCRVEGSHSVWDPVPNRPGWVPSWIRSWLAPEKW